MSTRSRELMKVSPTGGIYELRKAIAEYLKSFRGMLVDANQIVMGAGTEYLYGMLVQLLGNDREYCIENPGYKKLVQIYQQHQIICRYADMDEDGITVEGLRKSGADIAHISPGHHFPSGITMPAHRRYEVLAWANEKNGRYIIEDDYDSEFRYKGRPIPALQGNDTEGKVIYLGTFSRAIAPSIRISYMVLPETLLPAYEENGRCFSATVSKTDQKILEGFMRSGAFERHLNRMRAQYKGKHDLLIRLLKEFGREYTVSGENAGVHVLVHLPRGLSEAEAVQRAKEDGVRVYGLERYCIGAAADPAQGGTVLLGYAGLSEEEIAEAAAILKKCWNA